MDHVTVWGGLIARDVAALAREGTPEGTGPDMGATLGPLLARYGLGLPADDARLLEAVRRYWPPCHLTCRGAVLELADGGAGVSLGGRGLVVHRDGALQVDTWRAHTQARAYLGPGVVALAEPVVWA